ncbi:MAG TPA: hydroxymethylbilane synthase [Candidatus Acidoferrum sp.]|nr:hydroxymethylbilane synthase [Candidatus Acidoferrum sp.]
MPLRIGTRGSALALWQANHLREKLARRAGLESELVILKSAGDRFAGAGIEQLGIVGVFTKELEDALCSGQIDLAIHSMKDVPTEFSPACEVRVVFEREDPRDALITRQGEKLSGLPAGARIGTSSLRRASQLRAYRPDFQIVEMRGNVDTRLRKLDAGDCEALVLAVAGLTRLGFAERIAEILPPEVMLSAVSQGALGVEFLATRVEEFRFLDRLTDRKTTLAVAVERAFQQRMQGGCRVPLGAWARLEGDTLVVDACVLSLDGSQSIRRRKRLDGTPELESAKELGRALGDEMAAAGGTEILRSARDVESAPNGISEYQALAGKRILITRAPEHSDEWTEALTAVGAEIISLPMVRFVGAKDTKRLDDAIMNVRGFDWILLTSRVAAQFYTLRSRELGGKPYPQRTEVQPRTKIAVVGQGTAKAAESEGLAVDYVATTERGEGLARELAPSMRGQKILLPHSNLGGASLAKTLAEAGANVTSVSAYDTLPPESVDPDILKQIRAGAVDVVVFASPSAFKNFSAYFAVNVLKALASRTSFAAIGPTTRRAIEGQGIAVSIEPQDTSKGSLVRAIVEHFRAAAEPARVQ